MGGAFERLSSLDAAFLGIETDTAHMHVGAVLLFEAGPLAMPDGGVDFDRLSDYISALLDRAPRYRQRLLQVPGLGHPGWVDDEHFNLHYHLRHTALPRPGSVRQLKRLAGRVFSQPLDRRRPLWELWVVEGLDGGRFAIVGKVHHALLDGIAGTGLMMDILRAVPDATLPPPSTWQPRPAPTGAAALAEEAGHRSAGLRSFARGLGRTLRREPGAVLAGARDMAATLGQVLVPAAPTPLNPKVVGPHRRFDWTELDLGAVKAVKDAFHGTINDAVLSVAAGAIGRFLRRRGVDPATVGELRALVPVNVRTEAQRDQLGNRVALLIARLAVAETDPARRFAATKEILGHLKRGSGQVHGATLIESITDVAAPGLVGPVLQLAVRRRIFNFLITNVPGPPEPLYLLGARCTEIVPMAPLFESQALGVALLSYAGTLSWGLTADWELVPDLHDFVADLHASFEEMTAASRGASA